MFQIISFKEDGLANLALIKLCEDNSVRLLRSLNPDAEDGVQGEEFGEKWTLSDRGAAAAAFLNRRPGPTLTERPAAALTSTTSSARKGCVSSWR